MLYQAILLGSVVAYTLAQGVSDQYNLTSTLTQEGELSTFAAILSQYLNTSEQTAKGNVTILAPTDNAIAAYLNSSTDTSNEPSNFTEALLTYHILAGTHSKEDILTSTQFIPTMLTNASYANVTGGQRVEALSSDGQVYFLSGIKSRSNVVKADIFFAESVETNIGIIHVIDKVLTIPSSETDTVTDSQLTGFAQVLSAVPPDPRILGVIGPESDWIIFAPNHSQYPLQGLTTAAIYDVESYHFVKGIVKYSTDLTNGMKLQTVMGKDVTVTVQNGSIYINAAKIIEPDYLLNTGVLHLMDSANNPNDTSARPSPLDGSSTATRSTTGSVPASTSTRSPSASVSPSSSLSTGAKVGIGVGAAAGGLALISLATILLRRRWRQSKRVAHAELDSREKGDIKELHGSEIERAPAELESNERSVIYEMDDGR